MCMQVLQKICWFVVLAATSSDQVTLLNGTAADKKLDGLPDYKELLQTFITQEVCLPTHMPLRPALTTLPLHVLLLVVQLHQHIVKDSCEDLQKACCLHNDLPATQNLPTLLMILSANLEHFPNVEMRFYCPRTF